MPPTAVRRASSALLSSRSQIAQRRVGYVWISLAAALVAALCYGIAAVMQAMAVRAASRRKAAAGRTALGGVDPGLVVRMLHQWPFIASLGLDLIGFAGQLVALRRLPLFAAQAIIAGNLAVTAVFAAWLMHLELTWREWLAVAGVIVGVGMLGSSAGVHGATGVSEDFKLALVLAVAARVLPGYSPHELIRNPAAYALAAAGIVSFMLYATALEGGSVTVAT